MDDSETTVISASDALKSLEIENDILERYISERKANMMRQTNTDQYFMQCENNKLQ